MDIDHLRPRPSRDLTGKVAIVTGAGCHGNALGNGRAISLLLAQDGCTVVCVDMDEAASLRTVEMINAEGHAPAMALRADVSDPVQCEGIVVFALDAFKRVDILINNVGILGPAGTATEVGLEEWQKAMNINVATMMLMSKYAIPAMLKNKRDDAGIKGSIVNLGSVAGLQGGTPSLLYPTSKGAVVNMTRAMASHHGKDGIRVNCVCPGMIFTPMVETPNGGMSQETREARRKRSLLQTEGDAWDCAGPVRFLAGNEARWMTGSMLTVDAGASCSSITEW